MSASTKIKTLVVDDVEYTVTIGPYSPPGLLNSDLRGSIAAHVDVRRLDTEVNKVPEPSAMLLCGLGVTLLGGGAAWRKRRAATQV